MSEPISFVVDDFSATVLEPGGCAKIPINETKALGFMRLEIPEIIEVTIRVRTTYKGTEYLRSLFHDLSLGNLR